MLRTRELPSAVILMFVEGSDEKPEVTALIVGVSEFGEGFDSIDTSSVSDLRGALVRCGHRTTLGTNWSADDLRDLMYRAADGSYDVVHLLTHGFRNAASHGLWAAAAGAVCKNMDPGHWVDLRSWLSGATATGAASNVNLLVFLDICYGGDASRFDFLDEATRKIYVFAATEPGQLAFRARFTRAVAKIFDRLADGDDFGAHASNEFISLGLIRNALAAELDSICKADKTILSQRLVTSRHELWHEHTHPAFPNPNYGQRQLDASLLKLAQEEPALADSADPVLGGGHFLLRAAGAGANQATSGIHFVGRDEELGRLIEWLDCNKPDGWLRIVTGSPGMGKSALLGVIVCLLHPTLVPFTYRVEQRFVNRPYRRSVGQVAAVHSRNRVLREVISSLSRQLSPGASVEKPDDFVSLLRSLPAPPIIIVDALDEATDPAGMDLLLLQRLIAERRSSGDGICRLLVATRNENRFASLFAQAQADAVLDLDDFDQVKLRRNVSDYVISLLREHAPHWKGGEIPAAFATAVADAVVPGSPTHGEVIDVGPHLLAQLHTFRIVAQVAPKSAGAAARLGQSTPRSVAEAFSVEFETPNDGPADPWLRPMLTAFAFAGGTGMPLTHARSIARELSDTVLPECGDARIRELLTTRARFYLRTDVDSDGSALYALFHRSLQQHLRDLSPTGFRACFEALRSDLGYGTGQPDWANRATPYLRRHFGQHAIAAHAFDSVVTDPSYLGYAEHASVVRDLRHATSRAARLAATVYRASIADHATGNPRQRLERLALDAVRLLDTDLRDQISDLSQDPGIARWTVLATRDDRAPLLDQLDDSAGNAVACGVVDGHPVAVTGGSDGVIRAWDLATGLPLMRVQQSGTVQAIGFATVDDRPLAITGSDAGELLVWDLSRLQDPYVATLEGHNTAIRSIAVGHDLNQLPFACTASDGESVLVWDLKNLDGRPLGYASHNKAVRALAVGGSYLGPILVAGSSDGYLHPWEFPPLGKLWRLGKTKAHRSPIKAIAASPSSDDVSAISGDESGAVKRWHMRDLTPREESKFDAGGAIGDLFRVTDLYAAKSAVRAMAVGPNAGDPFVVAHANGDNRICWLDSKVPKDLRRIDDGGPIAGVACTTIADECIAVTVSERGTRAWGLTTRSVPRTMRRSDGGGIVRSVASATLNGAHILLAGSEDGTIRVLSARDPEEPKWLRKSAQCRGPVQKVATIRRDGRTIVVGITSRSARMWDVMAEGINAYSSNVGLHEFPNVRGSLHALDCAVVDGGPIALIGGSRGALRLWDINDPERLTYRDLAGHQDRVQAIGCVTVNGQSIAATGDNGGRLRLWELSMRYHSTSTELPGHDAAIESIACLPADGEALFVSGSRDGVVKAWRVGIEARGNEGTRPQMMIWGAYGHEGAVRAAAVGTLDGESVAITGGTDNTVKVWRLGDGQCLRTHLFPSEISDVAITHAALAVCYRPDLAVLNYRGLRPPPRTWIEP